MYGKNMEEGIGCKECWCEVVVPGAGSRQMSQDGLEKKTWRDAVGPDEASFSFPMAKSTADKEGEGGGETEPRESRRERQKREGGRKIGKATGMYLSVSDFAPRWVQSTWMRYLTFALRWRGVADRVGGRTWRWERQGTSGQGRKEE